MAFDSSDVASGSAAMPMYFATSHELNAFQHAYVSATVTNDLNFGSTFAYLRTVCGGRRVGRGVERQRDNDSVRGRAEREEGG